MANVCPVHNARLRGPRGPTQEHHVEPAADPGSASVPPARRPDDRLAKDRWNSVPLEPPMEFLRPTPKDQRRLGAQDAAVGGSRVGAVGYCPWTPPSHDAYPLP